MNTNHIARLAIICATLLISAGGAVAGTSKGGMSVGLTIVSSCAMSGGDVAAVGSSATMKISCTDDTPYNVSLSSGAKLLSTTSRNAETGVVASSYQVQSSKADATGADANDVVVTLTY